MKASLQPTVVLQWFSKKERVAKAFWVQRVFALLEEAYQNIGGIRLGSGFESAGDMLRSIPVWRLGFERGQLVSVMVFKKRGEYLKMVAYAAPRASASVREGDLRCMLACSHAEVSGPLLINLLKRCGGNIRSHLLQAEEVLPEKEILTLESVGGAVGLPCESRRLLERLEADFPEVLPFVYVRNIGGCVKLKLLVGSMAGIGPRFEEAAGGRPRRLRPGRQSGRRGGVAGGVWGVRRPHGAVGGFHLTSNAPSAEDRRRLPAMLRPSRTQAKPPCSVWTL